MIFDILFFILKGALLLGFIAITTMFLVWMERKVSAHFQVRYGPMHVGWHGALQLIADMFKLIMKEDIVPKAADKWIFMTAPILIFVPAYLVFTVVPFAPGIIVKDLNISLLFILGITSLTVLAILMAGWSSNNKYSLLGGFRSVAQIISYEIPLILSIMPIIMIAHSINLTQIVQAQHGLPFILIQPFGFLLFFISATAEVNRAPFDIPEAEQELVAGYNVEYSGMRFVIFFLAEYVNLFAIAALATILFLGGWKGPILPPIIWFFLKTYFLVFLLMWVRWTYPRFRIDQLMSFCWKVLLPLSIINLVVSSLIMVIHA